MYDNEATLWLRRGCGDSNGNGTEEAEVRRAPRALTVKTERRKEGRALDGKGGGGGMESVYD